MENQLNAGLIVRRIDMTIAEKKQKILEWTDFYGGDIIDSEMVEKSKTNEDLIETLNYHDSFMENMLLDAKTHLNLFKKELGL